MIQIIFMIPYEN